MSVVRQWLFFTRLKHMSSNKHCDDIYDLISLVSVNVQFSVLGHPNGFHLQQVSVFALVHVSSLGKLRMLKD